MGGREFEVIAHGHDGSFSEVDCWRCWAGRVFLLPSVETQSGPFQGRRAVWRPEPEAAGARFVALSFDLAMMTATCLGMIGAEARW